jgi:hypothetical protein
MGGYYIICRGYHSQDNLALLLREVAISLLLSNNKFFSDPSLNLCSDLRGDYFRTVTLSDDFDPTVFVQKLFELCETHESLQFIATGDGKTMDLHTPYKMTAKRIWSNKIYDQLKITI